MAVRATAPSLALLVALAWAWLGGLMAPAAVAAPRFEVLLTELNGAPIAPTSTLEDLEVGDEFLVEVRLTADLQPIVFYSISLDWRRRSLFAEPGVSLDNSPIFELSGLGPLREGPGFSFSYAGISLQEPFLGDGESVTIAELDFVAVGGSDGLPTPIDVGFFDDIDTIVGVEEVEFIPASVSILPEPSAWAGAGASVSTLFVFRRRTRARTTACSRRG